MVYWQAAAHALEVGAGSHVTSPQVKVSVARRVSIRRNAESARSIAQDLTGAGIIDCTCVSICTKEAIAQQDLLVPYAARHDAIVIASPCLDEHFVSVAFDATGVALALDAYVRIDHSDLNKPV